MTAPTFYQCSWHLTTLPDFYFYFAGNCQLILKKQLSSICMYIHILALTIVAFVLLLLELFIDIGMLVGESFIQLFSCIGSTILYTPPILYSIMFIYSSFLVILERGYDYIHRWVLNFIKSGLNWYHWYWILITNSQYISKQFLL